VRTVRRFSVPKVSWRPLATCALMVVLVGCTGAPGAGCDPGGPSAGPGGTTTVPDGDTTTTTPDETTTTTPTGDTTTTTAPGGGEGDVVRVADLSVADCLVPVGDDLMLLEVEVIDCDEPHEAEVFATFDIADGELPDGPDVPGYPGGPELTWYAQDQCTARLETYLGTSYWDSDLDVKVITPSFSTWDLGDRRITCLAMAEGGGSLTGPIR
jgi:hypothetical protein